MSNHISFFKPAFSRIPTDKITIEAFVNGIKYGDWQTETEAVRNEPDDKKRKELKSKVPGVTCSGVFSPTREEANIIEHSGYICIDVDDFTDRTALVSDRYSYAVFSSVSSTGLAVMVKINPAKHKESFAWLQNYYYTAYGISVDPAPSNPASLRFVSFDPQCFINENSERARTLNKKHKAPKSLPMILPDEAAGKMVQELVSRGINIAEDYQSYLQLGFAIASGFGEAGRAFFHAIAGISAKYNSGHCDKQYDRCLKTPNKGISVGTFYHMLKTAGIEFPRNEQYDRAVRDAAIGKKAGRTQSGIAESIGQIHGMDKDMAKKIVGDVFERPDISLKTIAADSEQLIESLVAWMSNNHPVRKNMITGKIEEGGKELSKERMNTIFLRARAAFNTPNISFDLIERVLYSDFTPEFHPIKEYIEANRHRNTTGNIDKLIACINTKTLDAAMFIRKWLVAIPAAIDGVPVRLVLSLVGPQLSGKCLAKGTNVLMYDLSKKKVEDIVVGDILLGPDNTPRNVLSTCSGKETMYKITQHNGNPYTVNESHILSLQNRISKKILNIPVLDYLKLSNGRKSRYYGYKGMYKSNTETTLPLDPYFLGVWLGDGQGGGNKKERAGNLKHILYNLNLNKNKHIPHVYQTASTKQRLELLAGLIDTDGSLDTRSGAMEITQVNKQLANDIIFLCRGLGLKCSINNRIINGKIYYRMHIGGNIGSIPCKIKHKQCGHKYTYDSTQTGIKLVENVGVGDYYGFTIDGDKLFMLDDFTVTHNTEYFRRLLPDKLKRYYGESKLDAGKDDWLLMTSKLIICDDELGGKSKQDEKIFKDLTSKSVFSLRAPYGRNNEDFKRLAVLCGTSNDLEIISDPTGNTRILPVEVISINHEAYNSIDKDELFMEVVRAYESGEKWAFDKGNLDSLAVVSNEHEAIPYERELILKYFLPKNEAEGNGFVEKMTATDIKDYIEARSQQQVRSMKRLGMELRAVFGERTGVRVGGKILQLYSVVKLNENSQNGLEYGVTGAVTEKSEKGDENSYITQSAGNEELPF